jgi:hypothetical protein
MMARPIENYINSDKNMALARLSCLWQRSIVYPPARLAPMMLRISHAEAGAAKKM